MPVAHERRRSDWTSLLVVFAVSTSIAISMQWVYASGSGGWSALIGVGEEADVRPLVESDFGTVQLAPGLGHDGRYSYVVARDLRRQKGWLEEMDVPAVRYRRILYPALAGAFGTLGPKGTLAGLVGWSALGFGASAAAAFWLAGLLGARRWAVLGVLANFGFWHSFLISSPDALGFGLSLTGVALVLGQRHRPAVAALTAAVLAKDILILVPLGVALWLWFAGQRTRAAVSIAVPAATLGAWTLYTAGLFPESGVGGNGLSAPFVGLPAAAPGWSIAEALFSVIIILSLITGPVLAWRARSPLLVWLAGPWLVLAAVSSDLVWHADAPRVFALAFVWALLGAAVVASHRHRPHSEALAENTMN